MSSLPVFPAKTPTVHAINRITQIAYLLHADPDNKMAQVWSWNVLQPEVAPSYWRTFPKSYALYLTRMIYRIELLKIAATDTGVDPEHLAQSKMELQYLDRFLDYIFDEMRHAAIEDTMVAEWTSPAWNYWLAVEWNIQRHNPFEIDVWQEEDSRNTVSLTLPPQDFDWDAYDKLVSPLLSGSAHNFDVNLVLKEYKKSWLAKWVSAFVAGDDEARLALEELPAKLNDDLYEWRGRTATPSGHSAQRGAGNEGRVIGGEKDNLIEEGASADDAEEGNAPVRGKATSRARRGRGAKGSGRSKGKAKAKGKAKEVADSTESVQVKQEAEVEAPLPKSGATAEVHDLTGGDTDAQGETDTENATITPVAQHSRATRASKRLRLDDTSVHVHSSAPARTPVGTLMLAELYPKQTPQAIAGASSSTALITETLQTELKISDQQELGVVVPKSA